MVGTVSVRWCPRCRTWGKARRVQIDPSQGFVPRSGRDADNIDADGKHVCFEYVREDFRCESCTADFTSTRITSCEPAYVWSARSVLAKLQTLSDAATRTSAIPVAWHGHPELADFSAIAHQHAVARGMPDIEVGQPIGRTA